jgi:hypothetical protein
MKKSLFATTAIVAAFSFGTSVANAQDASLELSAFSDFMAGVASQDDENGGFHEDDYDFSTNTEFEVSGQVTLDNGITAGLDIEVEADNADGTDFDGDNIDENVIYLDGSFGRVEFGHEDGAGDVMAYGATSIKAVYYGTYNNTTGGLVAYGTGDAPVLTNPVQSSDATKITYFTPRIAGLQAGVSVAPDGNADNVIPARGELETTDLYEAGLNYVNSFNGFDIAASVTGGYRNVTETDTAEGTFTNAAGQDIELEGDPFIDGGGDEYSVTPGIVVGFGGFEFGGSVGFGQLVVDGEEEDFLAYDAGIAYSTGPWSVSLTGLYSEVETSSGDEDERYELNSGINYALGSGVRIFLSAAVGEEEEGEDGGDSNDYVQAVSGVGVSF